MGMYKFKPEDAERFAYEMRIQAYRHGDELIFKKCPYCRERTKDKEKFSINLITGQFNCFRASCGAHGNMITLAKDFNFSLGTNIDEYYRSRKRFRKIKIEKKPEPKPFAIEWMQGRGISEAVTKEYGITVRNDNPQALVFPFYDENNEVQFIKYRNTDPELIEKYGKEWSEKNCKPILFGMGQCNMDNKTLTICEGQIDSMSCTEAGVENAVSVPTGARGFTWVPYCWDFLKQFETLIVFGDHEKGHITLLEEMKTRFDGTVKHVREEDYKDCKDANDILRKYGKEAVKAAVENAVCVENPKIISLADVARVNLSELEKFDTGLPTLNKVLGGFYMGQLIIVTGERGDGKSTLASQFATMAIKAGYEVFFYSGELIDWYFKAWFDYQVAGESHINGIQTRYGIDYHIDANVIPQMERWYADKIYLYSNSIVKDGDSEEETLLDTLECAVKQYGCRVLFVDNLMTAVQDDLSADIYRQQTKFVKGLALLAKRFNVLIFLIAHPKKRNGMEFSNDDVAGSSNVTNLADVIIRYMRPNSEDVATENPDRVLQVWKNRLTGRTIKKISLWYEESSKRIAEAGQKFDWRLGWENTGARAEKPQNQPETSADGEKLLGGFIQYEEDDDDNLVFDI